MSRVKQLADAFDAFVKGTKADGTWDAIKASCIMAGWDNLSGALTPLKGAAPTNNNFVSGDYDRETGLVGNGTTKYLNSNRASNADPQNSVHISVYVSTAAINTTRTLIGDTAASAGQTIINGVDTGELFTRARTNSAGQGIANLSGQGNTTGFKGKARSAAAAIAVRSGGTTTTDTTSSGAPTSEKYGVFARTPSSAALFAADRIAFYSIGESLDLEDLDTRVSALITAIGAAI